MKITRKIAVDFSEDEVAAMEVVACILENLCNEKRMNDDCENLIIPHPRGTDIYDFMDVGICATFIRRLANACEAEIG